MNGFNDYRKFLMDLQKALNGEADAIAFYTQLLGMTNNPKYIDYITDARDDERRHLQIFTNLYIQLTGRRPTIEQPKTTARNLCEGAQIAFDDELEAYILYRDMMLNTMIPQIRDMIFVPFTDENEHAQKFNWILSDLKSKDMC